MPRSFRWLIWLILVPSTTVLSASGEDEGVAMLLQLDKQQPQPLPFFVRHAPAAAVESPDKPVGFVTLPDGVTAHLTEVGYLAGRHLFAIRYLTDARLLNGNNGAIGFVLLCSTNQDPPQFAPLYVAWGEYEGLVDDYSVSDVRQFGDFSYVWLRTDTSGTANFVGRTAISAPDAETPLRAYQMFADTDPLAELEKQGWELWHRGNYFDEDSLTWHYHIYRDPAKGGAKEDDPHRHVQVRYSFRDGKLHPGEVEEDEE